MQGFPTEINQRPHTCQLVMIRRGAWMKIREFYICLTTGTGVKLHHISNNSGMIVVNYCNKELSGFITLIIQQNLTSQAKKIPWGLHAGRKLESPPVVYPTCIMPGPRHFGWADCFVLYLQNCKAYVDDTWRKRIEICDLLRFQYDIIKYLNYSLIAFDERVTFWL